MDAQPPEAAKDILSAIGTWIMWFILSIASSSVSAIKRAGTIYVAAYWVVLSSLVGPGLAVIAVVYWGVNVFVGAVICGVVGLMIAGIAGQIELLNNRVGKANLNILLAGWAKIAAAKASKLAGQANQSAQQATEVSVQNQVKIDAGRKEAKEDLSTQTATLMNKIPEKVVAVVKTET